MKHSVKNGLSPNKSRLSDIPEVVEVIVGVEAKAEALGAKVPRAEAKTSRPRCQGP